MRIYRCAIKAERARSASEWAMLFQTNACQSLRSPTREPLPRVADRILRLRPGADAARVRALIDQLDSALYNDAELDIRRWKRDLRRALRPGWGAFAGLFGFDGTGSHGSGAQGFGPRGSGGQGLGSRLRRRRLPALNPSPERSWGV
jgi:hypothetical protein